MKNTLPYILKIEEIKPYQIKLRFNNNELRQIKFTKKEFMTNNLFEKLLDKSTFSSVSLTEKGALCWKNITYTNSLGKLDFLKFDTLKIYQDSKLIQEEKIIIDSKKELTQTKYAQKYGFKIMDVMNKVRRGQLKTRFIEELGIKLIVIS
ncbi:MAG: hypothetical protein EAZ27_03220 [Cytophagales bacterium]|nr:MAG: hypothetical protein EAZ27_03220 [Cytophagales bacterium]